MIDLLHKMNSAWFLCIIATICVGIITALFWVTSVERPREPTLEDLAPPSLPRPRKACICPLPVWSDEENRYVNQLDPECSIDHTYD